MQTLMDFMFYTHAVGFHSTCNETVNFMWRSTSCFIHSALLHLTEDSFHLALLVVFCVLPVSTNKT